MFHFLFTTIFSKKLSGRKVKPQWERFKTSMGEKSNPNGRNATETLKSKMKHRIPMFHLLKVLIINTLCYKNETWNKKRLKVNIMYARVRSASSPVVDASPQVRTLPQRTYIYTREITPFMFFSTKHKKIIPIICSFKAEQVLLPCYSFPAKKSLKKVSFFKSLVYNVLRV